MCWTISWQNKLHWLWHHGIALSGNALPSNYHQLPVLTQDLGSHKFPGDKTGSTTVVTQWLITTQTVTSTRNKKAPFLDTFRFSAMHCKELSVELHKFHTKPYDFKCVVILTLSLYIYRFIHSIGMCRMQQFLAIHSSSSFHYSLLRIFIKHYKLTTWKEILKILPVVSYFKMLCSYFVWLLSDIFIFVVCIVGVRYFPWHMCRFRGIPLNRHCPFHSYFSLLTTFHG